VELQDTARANRKGCLQKLRGASVVYLVCSSGRQIDNSQGLSHELAPISKSPEQSVVSSQPLGLIVIVTVNLGIGNQPKRYL